MRKIVIAGAIVYLAVLIAAIPVFWERASTRRIVGWETAATHGLPVVISVEPGGPADGRLMVGDGIVSVDGESGFRGSYLPWHKIADSLPGATYTVAFQRGGVNRSAALRIESETDHSSGWLVVALIAGSLTFLSAGILMGWQRPDAHAARLGWLSSQFAALTYIGIAVLALRGWIPTPLAAWLQPSGTLCILATWWFVSAMQAPAESSRFWRIVGNGIVALAFLDFWWDALPGLLSYGFRDWHGWSLLPIWWMPVRPLIFAVFRVTVVIAMLAVVFRNHRMAGTPLARRQIEIVGGAIAFGMGTAMIAATWQMTHPGGSGFDTMVFGSMAPLVIPWLFSYAVLKHQVLDIRLVVRRGLQHLLARQVLRALTLAPLGLFLFRAWRNPSAPVGSVLNFGSLAVLVVALVCLEFRVTILNTFDRWFFRQAQDRERALRQLLAAIGRVGSFEEIVSLTRERLISILAVTSADVVIGVSSIAAAAAAAPREGLAISICSPAGQREGVLLLSAKSSDEPYTAGERELLDLIAAQIGLVRENLLLASQRFEAVLEERTRIARELHDTLSQGFAGISLHLEAVRASLTTSPEQARKYLDVARELARESIQETRESLRGLRATPQDGHIGARLRALGEAQMTGPKVSVILPEGVGEHVAPDTAWHLARLAEEAVANARKHSGAKRIDVRLAAEGGRVVLKIIDDGEGFDPEHAAGRGFGLLGMRERMEQVGGSLQIVSRPGAGTEIRAAVSTMQAIAEGSVA